MSEWLLIPMQPTPNGRLHIGHGGGPYLRADAIARALRRDGHHAKIITIPGGTVLANSYYAYSLYCGQLHDGTGGNALSADSNVTVVGLFGTDNSIAGLLAPHVLATGTDYKPFDHTVVSHMLHFQGRKCSTSQRHGIGIADLIDNTTVTSDELRWVLASIQLDYQVSNIDTTIVVKAINDLRSWRSQTLRPALETAAVDLAEARHILQDWMLDKPRAASSRSAVTWLVGTALLAAPILPDLAGQLWAALTLPGIPARRTAESASWPRSVNRTAVDITSPGYLAEHDVAHVAK